MKSACAVQLRTTIVYIISSIYKQCFKLMHDKAMRVEAHIQIFSVFIANLISFLLSELTPFLLLLAKNEFGPIAVNYQFS